MMSKFNQTISVQDYIRYHRHNVDRTLTAMAEAASSVLDEIDREAEWNDDGYPKESAAHCVIRDCAEDIIKQIYLVRTGIAAEQADRNQEQYELEHPLGL
jgi:hypothetical protein